MSKILGPKTDFRVVIEPRRLGDFGSISTSDSFIYGRGKEAEARIAKDYQERCEEIVSEVKRHVDNVSSVYVDFEQQAVCEHCGWGWTETSKEYNGGCCEKDEQAHAEKQSAASDSPAPEIIKGTNDALDALTIRPQGATP